jgi:hypothetical protein
VWSLHYLRNLGLGFVVKSSAKVDWSKLVLQIEFELPVQFGVEKAPNWCHCLRNLNEAFEGEGLNKLVSMSLLSPVQPLMKGTHSIQVLKRMTQAEE